MLGGRLDQLRDLWGCAKGLREINDVVPSAQQLPARYSACDLSSGKVLLFADLADHFSRKARVHVL